MTATEFNDQQYEFCYSDGVENNYWSLTRNRRLAQTLRAAQLQNSRILEVGCGRGIVVDYMRKHGYDFWGVELAKVDPVKTSQDYLFPGTDALQLKADFRNSVQAIMLLDVIEHIPEPKAFLSGLLSAFPNVNHVIIAVPARTELWSNYDTFYGHYRRYSRESLAEFVASVPGAALVNSGYFFKLLYLPARVVLALFKQRSVKITTVHSPVAKLVHKFIAQGMTFADTVLPKGFYGSSLLAVVKINR